MSIGAAGGLLIGIPAGWLLAELVRDDGEPVSWVLAVGAALICTAIGNVRAGAGAYARTAPAPGRAQAVGAVSDGSIVVCAESGLADCHGSCSAVVPWRSCTEDFIARSFPMIWS